MQRPNNTLLPDSYSARAFLLFHLVFIMCDYAKQRQQAHTFVYVK